MNAILPLLPGWDWVTWPSLTKPRRVRVALVPVPAPRSILRLPGPAKAFTPPVRPLAVRPALGIIRQTIAPSAPVYRDNATRERAREDCTSAALHDLARQVQRLHQGHRDPELFYETRSEIADALRRLARSI